MKKWIIVEKETLEIKGSYVAEEKDDTSANRSWMMAEPICAHIELPEDLNEDCIKVIVEDDMIKLVEDEEKKVAKLNAARQEKLNQIRALREPKLKRVDQLINIAYLNSWTAAERAELRDYRQSLLDITEPYKEDASLLDDLDVNAIGWPQEPAEE